MCWRKPISFSNPRGLENVLAKANLVFNGMYHNPFPQNRRLPRLNAKALRLAMTKVPIASFCFAPRNDNEKDRELEGV